MSRTAIPAPKVDERTEEDLLLRLREAAPHYTREWPARDEDDPGVGLLRVFSFIAGGVIGSLNRAPERNFLAFLDMLGVRLLPAVPARAPVRFRVAQGTEDEFLVPQGTQVSAPAAEDRPEMPFVTTAELKAIPAALAALLAADPARDHIYKPPPNFLSLDLAATELPRMTVIAFSAAGSKTLQLDLVEGLEEGDFLKIEPPPQTTSRPAAECLPSAGAEADAAAAAEYAVVAEVKGQIVTLTAPLKRDYAEQTVVRKVTRFDLFEGRNFQEHILYLAHADYFDIKSEALIELSVAHAAGSPTNLEPLEIKWEFFGVTKEIEEEGWQSFKVELDETGGMSRDGRVVLSKPEGEIKETEINGNKSRWIRARLEGAAPATPQKIETVALAVSSAGNGIKADQGFHNDTPLTVNLKFHPFGLEPRIFDRFYLASSEAFSKPGAEVTLEVNLDFTDLLAAPAAIFRRPEIHAFAHGASGKLLEFQINPLDPKQKVEDHGLPTGTRISAGSRPAVVESGETIGVFVRANDGHIHLRDIPTDKTKWHWHDLKNDGLGGNATYDPAALTNNSLWEVYTVSNGQVFRKLVNPANAGTAATWSPLTGSGPTVTSSPFVLLAAPAGSTAPAGATAQPKIVWVFVTDAEGHTWQHNGKGWVDVTPKQGNNPLQEFIAAKNARPFAVYFEGGIESPPAGSPPVDSPPRGGPRARIFVRNSVNELVYFDTTGESTERKNLRSPAGTGLDSNPHVVGDKDEERIFVRTADSRLFEMDVANEIWKVHQNPSDFILAGDPFISTYTVEGSTAEFLSVLSTTNKNSLVEFKDSADVAEGVLRAGPLQIFHLEEAPTTANATYFIQVTAGPGMDAGGPTLREFPSRDDKLAVLAEPLSAPATTATRYNVFRRHEVDFVVELVQLDSPPVDSPPGGDRIRLKAGTVAKRNDFLLVEGRGGQTAQFRKIKRMNGAVATVDKAWDTQPAAGSRYQVLRSEAQNKSVQFNSAPQALLSPKHAGLSLDKVLLMQITRDAGPDPGEREIVGPVASNSIAEVRGGFGDNLPQAGDSYRIFVAGLPQRWSAFRDENQTLLRPALSWEYWNGTGWVNLAVKDKTENLLVPGLVTFRLPPDMDKTDVAGQLNYWIRARIVGGDYGRERFILESSATDPTKTNLTTSKDPIRPPFVESLLITYAVTELKPPQLTLTFNNLSYLDQTAANATADKHFSPFLPLPDEQRALYFGFDKEFEGGPVRLYFAAKEIAVNEREKPKLIWSYTTENELRQFAAEDDTDALTKPDYVTWVMPGEFQRRQYFGETLFWVRASLAEGEWPKSPSLAGVFPNTVETIQARAVLNEILGSSTGVESQRFRFAQLPVLEGEEVRVREALSEDDRAQIVAEDGPAAILDVRDQAGRVLETWVRWSEVSELFDSGPRSRHYRLDRASGEIEFGNGVRGRIPQAGGDNVRAFAYLAGGGEAGNVAAGEINTPVTAVAGVESVVNPVAAGGGSEKATAEEMLEIGPAQLSHRDRAVTTEDFEQLASEASREIRKVRCVSNRNAAGRHQVGWISVYIVPDSEDSAPVPSLELRRSVRRYLEARSDLTLVAQDRLFVGPPRYVKVDVDVSVAARSFDVAGTAERKVREELKRFLHPLTGGPEGLGWDFGRDLAASDLYRLIEDIAEVDYVERLALRADGAEVGETVEVPADSLLAGGSNTVTLLVANREAVPAESFLSEECDAGEGVGPRCSCEKCCSCVKPGPRCSCANKGLDSRCSCAKCSEAVRQS